MSHVFCRLIRRIRSHWPDTGITLRGDGHYARPASHAGSVEDPAMRPRVGQLRDG